MSAVIFPNSPKNLMTCTESNFHYHFKPSYCTFYWCAVIYTIYQDFQPLSCSLNSGLTNAQSDTFQREVGKKERNATPI